MSFFGFPDQTSADGYFFDVPPTTGVSSYPSVFPSRILEELSQQPPEQNPLVLCANVGPWPFGEGTSSSNQTEAPGDPAGYLPSLETTWSYPGENVGTMGWSLLQERSQPVSSPLSSSESQQSLNFFSSTSSPDPFTSDGIVDGPNRKSKGGSSLGRNSGSRNNGILSVSERRARNKVASAKYREKKNRKEAEMSTAVEILTTRCSFLERQVKTLLRENQLLRSGKGSGGGGRDKGEEDGVKLFTEEMGLCM